MMTRDEFEEQLHRFARSWHGDIWAAMPGSKADDLRSPAIRAALLAAYDALAARIAELEADRDHWRNLVDDLQNNGIYLDSIAFYEGRHAESTARIAELEAALHMLVDWPDNDCEPGVYGEGYCVYGCQMTEGMDEEMHHAPYCPISLARAVLSKEA